MHVFGRALTALLLLGHGDGAADDFLPNWMGQLNKVLAQQTFLDLSLPGTHDTMTYDLSHTVADGGIDDSPLLASILHNFGNLHGIGDFIRGQAQTQALTVSEQLDAGVRFLDFRIMYTGGDWRSLHFLQTKQKVTVYLQEVRAWLDAHPTEVVALWLSKHGSECKRGNDQYPGVSKATKQAFWKEIQGVFDGLLLDTATSSLNGTAFSDLVSRNHRVVIFASDFLEFTGGTTLATDGCLVDNPLSMSDVSGLNGAGDLKTFAGFASVRAQDKRAGKFLLESMASQPPTAVISNAAKIQFLAGGTANIQACAKEMHIPGMTQWCPERIIDVAQLDNYYKQLTIDAAYEAGYEFPNAIYLNALGHGGLTRTGTRPLYLNQSIVCDIYKWTSCQKHQPVCDAGWTANGESAHWNSYDSNGDKHGFCGLAWESHYKCCRNEDSDHATDGYAFTDTLIAVNVRRSCGTGPNPSPECASATSMLAARRGRFPKAVWSDALTGRLSDWPKSRASVYV